MLSRQQVSDYADWKIVIRAVTNYDKTPLTIEG
jgi:hypothetical protein